MADTERRILSANEKYAKTFDPSVVSSIKPSQLLTVVCCMDARIHPTAFLGLNLCDANIMRNAGGSAREAARSILLSNHVLGTRDVYVIKHTDCGMLQASPSLVHGVMKQNLGKDKEGVIDEFEVGFIPDLEASCREDVEYLRSHPLGLEGVRVTGWIYTTETGELRKIVE